MCTIYIPTSSGYEALTATDVLSKNRCIWITGKIEGNMVVTLISLAVTDKLYSGQSYNRRRIRI